MAFNFFFRFQQIIKLAVIISAASFGLASLAQAETKGGDPFEPVFVDSLRVQAAGTGGRTAHREITISAGPDRVFLPETLKFVEASRSGGGSIWAKFREDKYTYATVPITVAGANYNVKMPRKIVIELHAETGSGTGNYNRGGWLNGYVHGETIEIDR